MSKDRSENIEQLIRGMACSMTGDPINLNDVMVALAVMAGKTLLTFPDSELSIMRQKFQQDVDTVIKEYQDDPHRPIGWEIPDRATLS